jgi:hypothetical protein
MIIVTLTNQVAKKTIHTRGRYQLGFYPVSPPVANIVIFVTNVNKLKKKKIH